MVLKSLSQQSQHYPRRFFCECEPLHTCGTKQPRIIEREPAVAGTGSVPTMYSIRARFWEETMEIYARSERA
jgi:hypothetical protein